MSSKESRPISDDLPYWRKILLIRRILRDRRKFAELAKHALEDVALDTPRFIQESIEFGSSNSDPESIGSPTTVANKDKKSAKTSPPRFRLNGRRITAFTAVAALAGTFGYLAGSEADKPKPEAYQTADIDFLSKRAALQSPAALGSTATCGVELRIAADWLTLEARAGQQHLTYPSPGAYAQAETLVTKDAPCAPAEGHPAVATLWVHGPKGQFTGVVTAADIIPYSFEVARSCDPLARDLLDGYAEFLGQPRTNASDQNLANYNDYLATTQIFCKHQSSAPR